MRFNKNYFGIDRMTMISICVLHVFAAVLDSDQVNFSEAESFAETIT